MIPFTKPVILDKPRYFYDIYVLDRVPEQTRYAKIQEWIYYEVLIVKLQEPVNAIACHQSRCLGGWMK